MSSSFRAGYEYAVEAAGGNVGAQVGGGYIRSLESSIQDQVGSFNEIANASQNKDVHYLKGDLFEAFHAASFNVDVARQSGEGVRAYLPRDTSGAQSHIDVVLQMVNDPAKLYQLKCYKTGEDTAKALSNPKYEDLLKVAPDDQIESIKKVSRREALRNLEIRPGQAEQYAQTAELTEAQLEEAGFTSESLTEDEALQLAKAVKKKGKLSAEDLGFSLEELIEWQDILRESLDASANAALLSIVLETGPVLGQLFLKFLSEEGVDPEDFLRLGEHALGSAGRGAIRGGVAGFLTLSSRVGYLGDSMRDLSPQVIGIGTVTAMKVLEHSYHYASSDLSTADFATTCLRDVFVLSAATGGGMLGQKVIPIPVLGSLVGNYVGATTASVAFDLSHETFVSIGVDSGFTFFGLVDQNYELPEEVLRRSGIKLLDRKDIQPATVQPKGVNVKTVSLRAPKYKQLERGLIDPMEIGYRYAPS